MKKNSPKIILCASLCAISIAGAGIASYASSSDSTSVNTVTAAGDEKPEGHRPPQDDGSTMAKVVSVSDDTLTILTSEQPGQNGEMPAPPADSTTPPEKPADGETPPEKPADDSTSSQMSDETATPPEKPEGDGKQAPPEITFSEESTTVTITSETTITQGMEKEAASLSDITADAIIRIVLDGSTATSIEIMGTEPPASETASES